MPYIQGPSDSSEEEEDFNTGRHYQELEDELYSDNDDEGREPQEDDDSW